MKVLVFDADALIKIARAGFLEKVSREFECVVPREVEREAVEAGKKKMFEDALAIEQLIRAGLVKVREARGERVSGLGLGELASLALYEKTGADAIVSDDRKFLAALQEKQIPFTTPTQLLAAMAMAGKIKAIEALSHLRALKPWVSENSFQTAFEQIKGEKK